MENEAIGSAGQFVSAVLQSAGFYAHANVLRFFQPFFNNFGALIYLAALLIAVTSVALYGNYRRAAYLLVGPGLFAFMIFNRIDTDGTVYQFGSRVDPQSREKQAAVIESSFEDIDTNLTASVSKFVAVYDNLVSYVVQRVVDLVVNTQDREDLIALARERMFWRVIHNKAVDPGFINLFTLMLQGQCSDYLRANYELSKYMYRDPQPESEIYQHKQVLLEHKAQASAKNNISLSTEMADYVRSQGFELAPNTFTLNCEQTWTIVGGLLRQQATHVLTPTEFEQNQFDVNWEQVVYDVQSKLCSEIARDRTTCTETVDLPRVAENIVMSQVVRNNLAGTPTGMLVTQFSGHEALDGETFERFSENYLSRDINVNKTLIMNLAATVPYIQGLILYLLLVTFPFFAIFLLMPNRYSTFFIWMSLWVWAKSWDIGYAVVYLIRELLWDLFPYVGRARLIENTQSLEWTGDSLQDLLNITYAADPVMNSTLYFTIIGSFTMAVPAVTAYLCLGAAALFEAMKLSLDQRPQEMFDDSRQGSMRYDGAATEANFRQNRLLGQRDTLNDLVANPGYAIPKNSYNPVDMLTEQFMKNQGFMGISAPDRQQLGDSTAAFYTEARGRYQDAQQMGQTEHVLGLSERNTTTNRPSSLFWDVVHRTAGLNQALQAEGEFTRLPLTDWISSNPGNETSPANGPMMKIRAFVPQSVDGN